MKYFTYVRDKQFAHALATLSPRIRYISAKRRWYAARLGLYSTISKKSSWLLVKTPRHTLVSTIANIKRRNLTENMAKSHIEHILYRKRYRQFHNEFIKEIISFYPEMIFNFLKAQKEKSGMLDISYYQGLYIALLQQYYPLDTNINNYLSSFLSYQADNEYTDKRCLYNNIALHMPLAKLSNLNQIFTHHQLSHIQLFDEHQQFMVTNLSAVEQQKKLQDNNQLHKVTVMITTYNASETIDSCIHSLLQQTWQDLEIIVVDDASTDDTLLRLQHLSAHNTAIKVISLPKNTGTFAAKSIGAQYATGEFLTCQDSDDWAHPQKIAEQVRPLIEDASIIATTSHWLRLDHDGQYYVRQIYPFLRQNPASPMFRLQTVKQESGLWHIVRTGADSEFFERLKLIYGNESIVVIKKPLTIASHRPNSLMTSEQFGIYNRTAALARLDYWEAWRLWHIDKLHQKACLVMPSVEKQANAPQALFVGIPDSIQVDMLNLKENLATHIVLSKL